MARSPARRCVAVVVLNRIMGMGHGEFFFCFCLFFVCHEVFFLLIFFCSFLWKRAKDGSVKVFKATGANDYLILSQNHFFAMGGG